MRAHNFKTALCRENDRLVEATYVGFHIYWFRLCRFSIWETGTFLKPSSIEYRGSFWFESHIKKFFNCTCGAQFEGNAYTHPHFHKLAERSKQWEDSLRHSEMVVLQLPYNLEDSCLIANVRYEQTKTKWPSFLLKFICPLFWHNAESSSDSYIEYEISHSWYLYVTSRILACRVDAMESQDLMGYKITVCTFVSETCIYEESSYLHALVPLIHMSLYRSLNQIVVEYTLYFKKRKIKVVICTQMIAKRRNCVLITVSGQ